MKIKHLTKQDALIYAKIYRKFWKRLCRSDADRERERTYRLAHADLYRAADKKSKIKCRDKVRVRDREKQRRYRKNPSHRIKHALYRRINHALHGARKSDATTRLLGCSIESFEIYLESLWETGMNWENYGKWQIDHVIPCALFDLSNPEHQKRCFHFSNMQPMWALQNRLKGKAIHV